ncbi:hypothetical protein GCM10027212_13060 [Actinotalea caeni]
MAGEPQLVGDERADLVGAAVLGRCGDENSHGLSIGPAHGPGLGPRSRVVALLDALRHQPVDRRQRRLGAGDGDAALLGPAHPRPPGELLDRAAHARGGLAVVQPDGAWLVELLAGLRAS